MWSQVEGSGRYCIYLNRKFELCLHQPVYLENSNAGLMIKAGSSFLRNSRNNYLRILKANLQLLMELIPAWISIHKMNGI
jgi:hypothetical protein